jgi:hypothetical protein
MDDTIDRFEEDRLMAEDRAALLEHYRTMREDLLAAIEGLTDAQMTEPTIDGWSVKDHLAHVAFWDELRAAEVARISAGHASAWRMNGEQDDALNTLAYSLRLPLTLDQARWELSTSRQQLVEALSSATPRAFDPSLYGEAGLRSSHEAQHAGWIRRWRGERGY